MGMAWLSTRYTRAPLGWVQCWMGKAACAQQDAPQQVSAKADRSKALGVLNREGIGDMG
jgi:hypothetical protein